MTRTIVIALAMIFISACPKSTPSTPPPGGGGDFDERQACTVDADCAAVEISCCDHCNGGTAVGVHKDYAAEVTAQYRSPEKCGGTACTMMACEQAVAICRGERCGVSIGGAEQVTPLPRP